MKKSLLLMFALFGSMAAHAQLTESPWVSATPDNGTFYLYNVESGMWLENNRRVRDWYTTRGNLGFHGFDFILTKNEEGKFQIDPRFGHNHSMNGESYDNPDWSINAWGYLDTGQPVTWWDITPTGIGYEITWNEGESVLYVSEGLTDGVVDNSWVIDNYGDSGVWQLITKEARLADLANATKESGKDATWLIDDWDFANANDRGASWQGNFGQCGAFAINGGWRANRAWECWNGGHGEFYQVITGLPNGTYGLTIQGFYRDGSTGGVLEKHQNGTEEIRAWYFANDAQAPFMSICDNGVEEEIPEVYALTSGFYGPGDGGSALPRASNGFYLGYYKNKELTVVVTDGTLKIGVRKESDTNDDWLVFDNFELTYYGSGIDLNEVKANLQKALDEVAAYEGTVLPVLAEAKSIGESAINSDDATTIAAATTGIQQALTATKAMNAALAAAEEVNNAEYKPNFFSSAYSAAQSASQNTDPAAINAAAAELNNAINRANQAIDTYNFYNATVPLALKDGVAQSVVDATKSAIEASTDLDEMNEALETLRIARKIAVAETHPDVFAGSVPEDAGSYYIYNVGLKRFLCGGGTWGAHAYVGFPGVEVTLMYEEDYIPEDPEYEGEPYSGFLIDTQLFNGDELHYLGYNGFMDVPANSHWVFLPVEGKTGVYNIARANGETNESGQRMLLGYESGSYGNINTDVYGESNPNNQWKLVTPEERDALLQTASLDHPQDATYKIQSPNFNQREDVTAWIGLNDGSEGSNVVIVGRNNNEWEFPFESWNNSALDLSQEVYDLEPGWYVLGVQGFYRDGDHYDQILHKVDGDEQMLDAYLIANFDETPLVNITSEIDQAPGYGDRARARHDYGEELPDEERYGEWQYIGEFPMWISQVNHYFQLGLYKKNYVKTKVGNDGFLDIRVSKEGENPRDWVVVDNFRLTYFGDDEPDMTAIENVRDEIANAKSESRIYNLQGMQVKGQLQRGLYIKDGKKVIVK